MEIPAFKLLLLDAAGHSVLLADGPSGEIAAEIPLPKGFTPVDLAVVPGHNQAYVALAGPDGAGHLLVVSLDPLSLERIPLTLPQPAQFAPRPDGKSILLADPAGTPYNLDLTTLTATKLEKPLEATVCVGIAATDAQSWGVWETALGGVLAPIAPIAPAWSLNIGGLPTSLTVADNRLLITFTATAGSGEGLLFASPAGETCRSVTLQCSRCAASHPVYPLHAAVDMDSRNAYVACEESAAVAVIDIDALKATRTIALGRSVSRLALVPGGRFAVAASNAAADLCLIDLINGRLLSVSATRREILSPLAIVD